MRKLVCLFSLLMTVTAFAEGYSVAPCSKDSDCVLYYDYCGDPRVALKASLPKEMRKDTQGKVSEEACVRTYIIDPQRNFPKNPMPLCLKNECVLGEGPLKKDK